MNRLIEAGDVRRIQWQWLSVTIPMSHLRERKISARCCCVEDFGMLEMLWLPELGTYKP